ncbi:hypothetical protein Hanom_Chr12g01088731 [Helianthus anomalus]
MIYVKSETYVLGVRCIFFFFFFLNGKFGSLTDHWSIIVPPAEPPDHIPSPLGIMRIHQFRRKPNKYGKNPHSGNRTQDLLVIKSYLTP